MFGQGAHEIKLMRGQPKATAIIGCLRLGIAHEQLRGGLFNDGRGDFAFNRVACALCGKTNHTIAFADGFHPILQPVNKDVIIQRLPSFVDDNHRRTAVQTFIDAVEQIHHRGRAQRWVIEQGGHVKASGSGIEV